MRGPSFPKRVAVVSIRTSRGGEISRHGRLRGHSIRKAGGTRAAEEESLILSTCPPTAARLKVSRPPQKPQCVSAALVPGAASCRGGAHRQGTPRCVAGSHQGRGPEVARLSPGLGHRPATATSGAYRCSRPNRRWILRGEDGSALVVIRTITTKPPASGECPTLPLCLNPYERSRNRRRPEVPPVRTPPPVADPAALQLILKSFARTSYPCATTRACCGSGQG